MCVSLTIFFFAKAGEDVCQFVIFLLFAEFISLAIILLLLSTYSPWNSMVDEVTERRSGKLLWQTCVWQKSTKMS